MAAFFEDKDPEIAGNEYLVMGTLEKRDWRGRDKISRDTQETIKRMYVFKDVWNFEPMPGWYPAKK